MTHDLEIVERKGSLPHKRPPLLFVHGSAHGAWCWAEHFLDYFADQGFSAYALSLRGHGASGGRKRLRWASIADYVDDVARVAADVRRTATAYGAEMRILPDIAHDLMAGPGLAACRRRDAGVADRHARLGSGRTDRLTRACRHQSLQEFLRAESVRLTARTTVGTTVGMGWSWPVCSRPGSPVLRPWQRDGL